MKKFILAIFMTMGLGVAAYGQDASDFIKFKSGTGNDDGLQIAVTEYVAANTSASVTLYGVVHVADAEYYKVVQTDLDKFDVVLYEGVKEGKNPEKPNAETKILNSLQRFMGEVLDLKFQKDSIDYSRPNLVHADITLDKLQESLKGKPITPLGQYINTEQLEGIKPFLDLAGNLIKELMKMNPELQQQLKGQLAQSLAKSDINAQLSPEMYKSIVLDRNQIVIETMQEQFKKNPNKKTYAIFYGAAHNPDLQDRLQKLGFKQSSKRWLTAWRVQAVTSDEEEDKPQLEKPQQRRRSDKGKDLDDEAK